MLGLLTIEKFMLLLLLPSMIMGGLFLIYVLLFNREDRACLKEYKKQFRKERRIFFIIISTLYVLVSIITILYALSFVSEYYKYGYATFRTLAPGFGANTLLGVILLEIVVMIFAIRLYLYLMKEISIGRKARLKIPVIWILLYSGSGLLSSIICYLSYTQMYAYH